MKHPRLAPETFPAAASALTLWGPAGGIEAATAVPEPEDERLGTVIVCHPHPLHGGTMQNKVVTMAERSLRESGLRTVRFNFRGVGASAGTYDDGNGEMDDLIAVAEWVRRVRPVDQLWLAGFSFGAFVAWRAARHLSPAHVTLIAPPVAKWPFAAIVAPACPVLVIQGDADDVAPPQPVVEWVLSMPDPPTLVRLPEADHFFHRRLMDLRGAIRHQVKAHLPPRAGG
jgi:alpha/beta superfamily hydrolase